MKLKRIFVIALLLLSVFLIYLSTMDQKVYYLALGDSVAFGNKSYPNFISQFLKEKNLLEEYRYEFIEDDLRITDLIRNIEDNKKTIVEHKEKTLKNALIKADLVTISIGNEELFYKMKTERQDTLYHYIDEMMDDMEALLRLIREYCKEDVFVLGYVNPYANQTSTYVKYANQKLETLAKKYEILYVSLDFLISEKNAFDELGISSVGQKKISQILFPLIEKKVIQDEK